MNREDMKAVAKYVVFGLAYFCFLKFAPMEWVFGFLVMIILLFVVAQGYNICKVNSNDPEPEPQADTPD